jgi:hypothetical protein
LFLEQFMFIHVIDQHPLSWNLNVRDHYSKSLTLNLILIQFNPQPSTEIYENNVNTFFRINVIMFIVTQSRESWCRHTIGLHAPHVSAYCGHHQVHRAFTLPFYLLCLPTLASVYTWAFVVQVYCLCNVPMLWNVLNIEIILLATYLLAGFCWTYFFGPEDGGDMFLRNVRWNSTDYKASYPRIWYSLLKSRFLKY